MHPLCAPAGVYHKPCLQDTPWHGRPGTQGGEPIGHRGICQAKCRDPQGNSIPRLQHTPTSLRLERPPPGGATKRRLPRRSRASDEGGPVAPGFGSTSLRRSAQVNARTGPRMLRAHRSKALRSRGRKDTLSGSYARASAAIGSARATRLPVRAAARTQTGNAALRIQRNAIDGGVRIEGFWTYRRYPIRRSFSVGLRASVPPW